MQLMILRFNREVIEWPERHMCFDRAGEALVSPDRMCDYTRRTREAVGV